MKQIIGMLTLSLALAATGMASAQTPAYVDSACGVWNGDAWVSNGNCDPALHRHERVAGTIIAVKGSLVTVQQTERTLVIDDSPALNSQLSGKVAVGRQIVAHGYWSEGTFFATMIVTNEVSSSNHY
jgi:hypothetical protein